MRALRELVWVELKLFTREPLTVVFVLVLPLVILLVLNAAFADAGVDPTVWEGQDPLDFYPASYVALVVATVGCLTLPVHLCAYREQGVLRRFRASALSPYGLAGAHAVVAGVSATVGSALLVVSSTVFYDSPLPEDWLGTLAAFLLVTASFTTLGALLGFVLPSARAAQGLGVLVFFVFMMLGGAGPPREVLGGMGVVADVLPMTYAGQLIRGPWLGTGWDLNATLVLLGVLVASAGLLAWRLRADEWS